MLQKKIALIGAAGVGKTSLVRRFVDSLFDEKYLTTIGVKVDRKAVRVADRDLTLLIWDIAGAEDHFSVPSPYVRGAAGYILVADGTLPETVGVAADLAAQIARDVGPLPFVLVLNKADLAADWRPPADQVATLGTRSLAVIESSARTGAGVEHAFVTLATALA